MCSGENSDFHFLAVISSLSSEDVTQFVSVSVHSPFFQNLFQNHENHNMLLYTIQGCIWPIPPPQKKIIKIPKPPIKPPPKTNTK